MSDYSEVNKLPSKPSRQESRRRRQGWLVLGAVLGSLGLVAAAVIDANNDSGTSIDHILEGTTTHLGIRIAYAAGLTTQCLTESGKPATVQITADLITQSPDNIAWRDGSSVVRITLSPGAPDCGTAVTEAYANRTTFATVKNTIVDAADSIDAEDPSSEADATAQKYITDILKAFRLKEAPIIQG